MPVVTRKPGIISETRVHWPRPTNVLCAGRHSVVKLGWVLLVLLVLVNFTAVQSASAMELHPDGHGASDHCCPVCHGGHFPVLPAVSNVQLGALAIDAWRDVIEVAPPASGDGRTFNSSRAPPV